MKTVRVEGVAFDRLCGAAVKLKTANDALAKAKKDADAAKETITKWLDENRAINVDRLPVGEFVNVEGIVMIEVGKARRFDEAGFAMAHPELKEEWTKDQRRVQFKPAV